MTNSRKAISVAATLATLATTAAAWAQTTVPTEPTNNSQPPANAATKPAESATASEATTAPAAAPVAAAPLPPPGAFQAGPFAPQPATLASAAPPPPPPPPAAFPNKLAIGKDGWLQFGALIQTWYDLQWNSGRGERHTKSTFRVRRAEIKVSGDIIKDVASFTTSFDPAATLKFSSTDTKVTSAAGTPTTVTTYAPPGNTGLVKLAYVTLKSPYVEVSLGQLRHPFGYESQLSSAELSFAERSFVTRYFGDLYDMGVRLEKKFEVFKYGIYLFNGSGQNQIDPNKQKDLVVRLDFTPIDGLRFSTASWTSIGQRSQAVAGAGTKDKIEFSGGINKEGVLLQGELLWSRQGSTRELNERTKATGRYVTAGYTIAGKVQPVIRYGFLGTDHSTIAGQNSSYPLYSPFGLATDEVRSYEVGLNYYLQGNGLKLQACYGYYDFDNIQALQEGTIVAQASF